MRDIAVLGGCVRDAPVAPVRYRSVRLPEPLLEKVDAFVRDNDAGFTSTPEVLKQAVREFLERRAEA